MILGLLLAIVFLAIGAFVLVVYGGTPHGGPTTDCGPITVFSHVYTVHADCRYISIGELAAAGLCLFLAIVAALNARPRG